MRTHKLIALAAGAILWGGLSPFALAQEPQPPQEPQKPAETAGTTETTETPEATGETQKGFSFRVDHLVLGYESTDNDTSSAKLVEYRDFDDGVLGFLSLSGVSADGERYLDFDADRMGRDDGRYTFGYGAWGRYGLFVDYNQIVHRFGNDGRLLWTRTADNRFSIPDEVQSTLQSQIIANQSRLNFDFLNGLIQPFLAGAHPVDVGLERDRLLARFELGRMARLNWGLEYAREERDGTRPFGGSFGFNNVTEIPEPIDYTTQDAEISGEWNGQKGGLRFGYRMSTFDNDIDTLFWDNPWRITDGTDGNAYQSPSTSSVNGAATGFADLAPDNEARQLFLSGRARAGTWFFNGNATMINMTQDDPLLPYTLNTAIQGINFDGSTFDPTNLANLPVQQVDHESEVLTFNGQAGTDLGERFDLTFRYRYYDYDNQSPRIELPGYVRFHAVWEAIPRITVPYAYTKQDANAEFGWDIGTRSRLALSYGLQLWDREFREVESSDEDILRLTFDTRPMDRLTLRARYETGDRSIDGYDPEAAEASFLDPGGVSNLPELRKYAQAAREYDDYNLQAQWFASDAWNFTVGVTGRSEDYDESDFGLISDEILQYNGEAAYVPGENLTLYVFGHFADRQVFQRSRQSGSTPSTNPLDDWMIDFDEDNMTLGAGLTTAFAKRFTLDVSARHADSDGFADFTAFPGGAPLGSSRTAAQDIPNYEDIELTSILAKLDYKFNDRFSLGFAYLWEDYTIDSFILQDLQNYLPGALIINANNGDYNGQVFRFDLGVSF